MLCLLFLLRLCRDLLNLRNTSLLVQCFQTEATPPYLLKGQEVGLFLVIILGVPGGPVSEKQEFWCLARLAICQRHATGQRQLHLAGGNESGKLSAGQQSGNLRHFESRRQHFCGSPAISAATQPLPQEKSAGLPALFLHPLQIRRSTQPA